MKFLPCLFLLLYCVNAFSSMEEATQTINRGYPETRYATSIYSVVFGGMAIWKGTDELSMDKPKSHDALGGFTVLIGSTRVIDGTIGLFRPYEAERLAKENKIQDPETLERLAKSGFYSRIMRSSLIAANSVTFLALYYKKDSEYKLLVYPGVIMAIIATANMINKSPEEKALKKEKESSLSFDFIPTNKGGQALVHFTF